MTHISCTCPDCGQSISLTDDAILDSVRILHGSGITAQVPCPHCGKTVPLPPSSDGESD